ncbi:MAG: hypothetical protein EBQ96_01550 [Proteobacteria bacterium]|nr:hypothetical protein [Pseudomonadota bacterium]
MARSDWLKVTETSDGVQFTIKQRRKIFAKIFLGLYLLLTLAFSLVNIQFFYFSVVIFCLGVFLVFFVVLQSFFTSDVSVFTIHKDKIVFQKKPYAACPQEISRAEVSHLISRHDGFDEKIGFNYRGQEVFVARLLSHSEASFLNQRLSALMGFGDAIVGVRKI